MKLFSLLSFYSSYPMNVAHQCCYRFFLSADFHDISLKFLLSLASALTLFFSHSFKFAFRHFLFSAHARIRSKFMFKLQSS